MDGVAGEHRKRLETIEDEFEDVKRRLGRIWNAIETTDIGMADASDRIREHRERKERLEEAAADARAVLSQRRAYLDDVNTISAYAHDMKDFLEESELTERRSFIESFVKEIIVIPGDALIRYTVPMPDDSFLAGRASEKVALDASVLSTVHVGPPDGIRIESPPLHGTAAAKRVPCHSALRRNRAVTNSPCIFSIRIDHPELVRSADRPIDGHQGLPATSTVILPDDRLLIVEATRTLGALQCDCRPGQLHPVVLCRPVP